MPRRRLNGAAVAPLNQPPPGGRRTAWTGRTIKTTPSRPQWPPRLNAENRTLGLFTRNRQQPPLATSASRTSYAQSTSFRRSSIAAASPAWSTPSRISGRQVQTPVAGVKPDNRHLFVPHQRGSDRGAEPVIWSPCPPSSGRRLNHFRHRRAAKRAHSTNFARAVHQTALKLTNPHRARPTEQTPSEVIGESPPGVSRSLHSPARQRQRGRMSRRGAPSRLNSRLGFSGPPNERLAPTYQPATCADSDGSTRQQVGSFMPSTAIWIQFRAQPVTERHPIRHANRPDEFLLGGAKSPGLRRAPSPFIGSYCWKQVA